MAVVVELPQVRGDLASPLVVQPEPKFFDDALGSDQLVVTQLWIRRDTLELGLDSPYGNKEAVVEHRH